MIWEEGLHSKFVHSEDNPQQDNYGEPYLDGDPLALEDFIKSLLKQQRESCKNHICNVDTYLIPQEMVELENAILNAPEPQCT